MVKSLRIAFIALFALLLTGILAGLMNNHLGPNEVDQGSVRINFDRSVEWLVDNEQRVLLEGKVNPMLWWFISKAVRISGDRRLEKVFRHYINNESYRLDQLSMALLMGRPLLNFRLSTLINSPNLVKIPDYNYLFAYGISCQDELRTNALIRPQLSTAYCLTEKPFSPACYTHQIAGFTIMQEYQCDDQQWVADALETLSGYVFWQLTFDFRLTDIYVQRLLMLYESGQQARVRGRWRKRFLDSQLDDGSWSSNWSLLSLGDKRELTIDKNGIRVMNRQGSFHTTAQGILLAAYILQEQNESF